MGKVRTNLEVSYDAKNPFKKAIVEISLNRWVEKGESFMAEITHDRIETVIKDSETYEQRFTIYSNSVPLEASKINALSNALKSFLPSNLSETDYRKILKEQALLLYVQTDWIDEQETLCAYNTLPTNWVLYV